MTNPLVIWLYTEMSRCQSGNGEKNLGKKICLNIYIYTYKKYSNLLKVISGISFVFENIDFVWIFLGFFPQILIITSLLQGIPKI